MAFSAQRALPSGVTGPVDFSALSRLAAICLSDAILADLSFSYEIREV
jgi:hypothetical protein